MRSKEESMALGIQGEWYDVCVAYAKRIGAKLLFVNSDSFGICTKDEKLLHIYADELAGILRSGKEL